MLHPDYHCVDSTLPWPERMHIAWWLDAILCACQQAMWYPHTQRLMFVYPSGVCVITTCN